MTMIIRILCGLLVCGFLLSPSQQAMSAPAAPVLKWQKGGCQTTWCRTGWYASPAVADIDLDGKPEVIWTDYRIVVVNGENGSDQWIISNPGGSRGWSDVALAHFDTDGIPEIITTHGGGWIGVTRHNGQPFPGFPQRPATVELRSLAVADADRDGYPEILTCSTQSDNQWFLLDHTGAIQGGWPRQTDSDANGYASGCFNQNVGLADLDRDGYLEMIGPNDTHYVAAYRFDGSPLHASSIYGQVGGLNKPWARVGFHYDHAVDLRGYANCAAGTPPLEPRPNFADSAPAFADVNNDGILEIIIIGNQYDCRQSPYKDLFHSPYILNMNRTRWSGNGFDWTNLPPQPPGSAPLSQNYNQIETVMPNPVVVDLDNDGFREILYSSYDGKLHAYWLDRSEHGNWPYSVYSGSGPLRFSSPPVVIDIDRDGKAEILFTTWTEKGSNQGGDLIMLDWQGNLLHSIPLPRSSSNWDGAMASPTIDNIDSDPDLEIVIGTAHMGLAAYDLPGSANARVLWATGRGSYLRTGQSPIVLADLTQRTFLAFLSSTR